MSPRSLYGRASTAAAAAPIARKAKASPTDSRNRQGRETRANKQRCRATTPLPAARSHVRRTMTAQR